METAMAKAMAPSTATRPLGVTTNTELLRSILNDVESTCTDSDLVDRMQQCGQLADQLDTNAKAVNSGILSRFNLSGQVALVTGGGQGIGRGLALGLGEAGAKVAVAEIMLCRAQVVVAELKAKGIEAIAIPVDVSKKDEVDKMVRTVVDTWGGLHIACNNAGIVETSTDSEVFPEAAWARTIGVNLEGVFFCCQAEAKHMLTQGYGRIINTASICAHVTLRPQNQSAYNAAKAGVRHLTRTLGAEWALRGVRVNSISPGYIETPLVATPELDPLKSKWIGQTPIGRLGQVEDLVGAVMYLASPASDFMTGSDLIIDGGFTCW